MGDFLFLFLLPIFFLLPIHHPLSFGARIRERPKKPGLSPRPACAMQAEYSHESLITLFTVFNIIHQRFLTVAERKGIINHIIIRLIHGIIVCVFCHIQFIIFKTENA